VSRKEEIRKIVPPGTIEDRPGFHTGLRPGEPSRIEKDPPPAEDQEDEEDLA
jgi:hypothetical protein